MAKYPVEFAEGYFFDNICRALHRCTPGDLSKMYTEKIIRGQLTHFDYKSFAPQYVDRYLAASGVHPLDVFYESKQIRLTYTPNDDFVIAVLDDLSFYQLEEMKTLLLDFFPNSLFSLEEIRPNKRLTTVLGTYPPGYLMPTKDMKLAEYPGKHFYRDLTPDMIRYRIKHKFSPRHVFDSNLWPDWATLAGVSLHWLFHLSMPMYCKTQQADLIFDYYTLLPRKAQEQVVQILHRFIEDKHTRIMALRKGGE